ncbi:beta-ketoacyl-ACP synthase III [Inhella sp.]|uniref:beta-ketoacyl-ACP synthase III n=1 Tax=Inhella sp. TaxID=1921806 RepID=UPI0035B4203A
MIEAVISGTGLYRPPHRISNEELVQSFNAYVERFNAEHAEAIAAGSVAALTPSSVEFIEKASGIKNRYVMDKDGVLDPARMYPRIAARPDDQWSVMAEMAGEAARAACREAGIEPSQIDAVYCASANMQRPYPAMACEIQALLGAKGFGYDMNVACSSATFGIEQAVNAVRCGTARCALVVSPEITSAHLEWRDRDCHFIFGDTCTAVLVQAATDVPAGQGFAVLGTQLATQYSNNIRNNFGFMNRCEDSNWQERDKTFRQEGRKVFKEVVPMAAAHIEAHLQQLGIEPSGVRRFWLHQANLGMNQLVIKKLVGAEAGSEVAPIILDEWANTASAGSIIAFHEHSADFARGELGVICSFGAGYSIGSVVLRKR